MKKATKTYKNTELKKVCSSNVRDCYYAENPDWMSTAVIKSMQDYGSHFKTTHYQYG